MKKLYLLLILSIGVLSLNAQILKPCKWSTETSTKSPKVGDKIELIFNVAIEDGWHLYSTDFDPDCGPVVTVFTFEKNDSYKLIGNIKPIGAEKAYDDVFECDYTSFHHKAQFKQTVKILKENATIKGQYDYQTCTDAGKCIIFDDLFTFNIKAKATSEIKEVAEVKEEVTQEKEEEVKTNDVLDSQENTKTTKIETSTPNLASIEGDFAKGEDGKEYVKFNNAWVEVPQGNSSKFYQKYLMLGGHE